MGVFGTGVVNNKGKVKVSTFFVCPEAGCILGLSETDFFSIFDSFVCANMPARGRPYMPFQICT